MKKLLALTVASVLCLGIAGHAFAGANQLYNIALDMRSVTKTTNCASLANTYTSCAAITGQVLNTTGTTILAVPVVYMFNAMQGIEFGLDWHSSSYIYTPTWVNCSDLTLFRNGGSNGSYSLTWSTCQVPAGTPGVGGRPLGVLSYHVIAPAGPTRIDFVNADGAGQSMVDCSLESDEVHTSHPGFVNMTLAPGDLQPCEVGPTATEATTWSGVKALYR
jgi:hypothetical protein